MSAVPLAMVKAALNIKGSDQDGELQDRLDEAEAEYAEFVGPVELMPLNHRAAVIADVAELWTRTQRGGGSGRPSFGGGGAGDFEDVSLGRPLVLFPRIRALTSSRQAAGPLGVFPPAEVWP